MQASPHQAMDSSSSLLDVLLYCRPLTIGWAHNSHVNGLRHNWHGLVSYHNLNITVLFFSRFVWDGQNSINFTKNFSSRSCISTREQLTRRYIYCRVSCLWWQIYISVSWARWEVCFLVIQLRGNLQNAKFYSKTKNLKVGLSTRVIQ